MSFPAYPADGQQITLGNVTYRYNSGKTAWIRTAGLTGNISAYSVSATGNVSAAGYYFANGAPFASSTYSNVNVEAYFSANISSLQSNISSSATDARYKATMMAIIFGA